MNKKVDRRLDICPTAINLMKIIINIILDRRLIMKTHFQYNEPETFFSEYQGLISHIVILGAGASRATCPNGDKNRRILPLMKDFVDVVEISKILAEEGIILTPEEAKNFELAFEKKIYPNERIRQKVEEQTRNYFLSLELPDEPTIYDYLILSLRDKDVIATFNWDPLLIQAYNRNQHLGLSLPNLIFLHGNVLIGFCKKCSITTPYNSNRPICPRCKKELIRSPLLFPISQKNYESHPMIKGGWETLRRKIRNAYLLTIFGYSAPDTDLSAKEILKNAVHGMHPNARSFSEIEIIDILSEEKLYEKWKDIIFNWHFHVTSSYFSSWINKHPRRSLEASVAQHIEIQFIDNSPKPPKFQTIEEMQNWFKKFKKYEK